MCSQVSKWQHRFRVVQEMFCKISLKRLVHSGYFLNVMPDPENSHQLIVFITLFSD